MSEQSETSRSLWYMDSVIARPNMRWVRRGWGEPHVLQQLWQVTRRFNDGDTTQFEEWRDVPVEDGDGRG